MEIRYHYQSYRSLNHVALDMNRCHAYILMKFQNKYRTDISYTCTANTLKYTYSIQINKYVSA
jgi:hypothetical protein